MLFQHASSRGLAHYPDSCTRRISSCAENLLADEDIYQSQNFPLPALSHWERVAEGRVRGERSSIIIGIVGNPYSLLSVFMLDYSKRRNNEL
jgi:hypothetical protein